MTPDGLEPLETDPQEIAALVDRYRCALADANVDEQSDDGRYIDAYEMHPDDGLFVRTLGRHMLGM